MYIEGILAAAIPLILSLYVRFTFHVSVGDDGTIGIKSLIFRQNPPLSSVAIILLALSELVIFYYYSAHFGLADSLGTLSLSIVYLLLLYLLVSSAVFALADEARAFLFLLIYMAGSIVFVAAASYGSFIGPALESGNGLDAEALRRFVWTLSAALMYLVVFGVLGYLGRKSPSKALFLYVILLCVAHVAVRVSLLFLLAAVIS